MCLRNFISVCEVLKIMPASPSVFFISERNNTTYISYGISGKHVVIRNGQEGLGLEPRWRVRLSRRPSDDLPQTHLASCNNGYHVSFTGVKQPGRRADHPPSSSAGVEYAVDLYLYLPSAPNWNVKGRSVFFTSRKNWISSTSRYHLHFITRRQITLSLRSAVSLTSTLFDKALSTGQVSQRYMIGWSSSPEDVKEVFTTCFCDMIWYMIWCAIWYDVLYDIWRDVTWRDVTWRDDIWYMIYDIWYMIWYDMIWYDMIWYMIWYDMIWYDMIWYDMIWYDRKFTHL